MIKNLEPYKEDKELIRMLTDPVKKTEYTIRDTMDEEIIYQMSLRSAESYLMLVWKMLHGLSLNPMRNKTDLETTHYLYQNSKLWFRKEMASTESDLFIGRFLSEITLYLSRNLDKIVVDYVIHSTHDILARDKIDMLDQVISCFSNLAKSMICNKTRAEESDKLFELATLCADGGMKRRTKLIRIYNDQMAILRDVKKNGILGVDFNVEDVIIINNIVLLAYMMATEDPKAEGMFSIDSDISFKDDAAVKHVVSKLGNCILEKSNERHFFAMSADRNNLAGLYAIFLRCKPEENYRFEKISADECLREGCRALSYLGFLSQSKIVKTIIRKMIY